MKPWLIGVLLAGAFVAGASAGAPWRLTPQGVGPVRLGMTTEQAFAAAKPLPVLTAPASAQGCQEFRVGGARPFHFLAENGRVVRVSVTEPSVRTARGIGVGDSAEAVRRTHGAAAVQQPAPFDDLPAHDLVVWISPGRGLRFEIGLDGKVILIHAGGKAIQYIEGCV